ncbi:MAG: FadR/GntR family transcriptional regulator [Armatimonadota bacterium]|nr:FadR/GntR family transcriptional regulator [Armatimonadota bacterium]MDR7518242.1 FadR/GntR family transcriptional regulator [Armatimonadota bacterium]MDR7548666.1 FadR/GntR family transcriptional regulator [Armatimonadota bacterium]
MGQEPRVDRLEESLEPVRRTKVHEEVASRIRRLIADGRLKPGDKLPPERQLAAALGVSRTSVRDAIRTLEVAGLLEPRQGEGTVVRELSADNLVAPLASALLARRDLLADLLAVRKMIEPAMAREAARHATPEEVQALEAILARQAAKVEAGGLAIEEDSAFHDLIARASRNQVVLRVIDVLMDLLREGRERSLQGRGRPQRSLRGHRQILEAIRRRDAEAAGQAMLTHLEQIEEMLLSERQPVGAGTPRR